MSEETEAASHGVKLPLGAVTNHCRHSGLKPHALLCPLPECRRPGRGPWAVGSLPWPGAPAPILEAGGDTCLGVSPALLCASCPLSQAPSSSHSSPWRGTLSPGGARGRPEGEQVTWGFWVCLGRAFRPTWTEQTWRVSSSRRRACVVGVQDGWPRSRSPGFGVWTELQLQLSWASSLQAADGGTSVSKPRPPQLPAHRLLQLPVPMALGGGAGRFTPIARPSWGPSR